MKVLWYVCGSLIEFSQKYLENKSSLSPTHQKDTEMKVPTATPDKKLFVPDTNVLMHDPASIFRFKEHDVFIPMVVLEEMDHHKKGLTEIARNVRQTSRFIDSLIKGTEHLAMKEGIPLSRLPSSGTLAKGCTGRLFFQTQSLKLEPLPAGTTTELNDNTILKVVIALQKRFPNREVVLVSKDINMRIKAATLELQAEDYENDEAIEDAALLYTGIVKLPPSFWKTHSKDLESWKDKESGNTFYKVTGPLVKQWYPNQFLYVPGEPNIELIVHTIEENKKTAILRVARDFRAKAHNVWGITARNMEQNFALNALTDPNIDFVTLLGTAGTGKTLLSLAVGLVLTLEKKTYQEIIMTRETVPIGEDIGFLPGTEEEKMAPWMGALMDNLELLGNNTEHTEWENGATKNFIMNRIKIRSLNFMRGRTFLQRWLIIDEAQNLTAKQVKTLITRAGPGTKIICIGNLSQIDTPYLTATTSGLTYVVERFKNWPHGAHITLKRGERSRLADHAEEVL